MTLVSRGNFEHMLTPACKVGNIGWGGGIKGLTNETSTVAGPVTRSMLIISPLLACGHEEIVHDRHEWLHWLLYAWHWPLGQRCMALLNEGLTLKRERFAWHFWLNAITCSWPYEYLCNKKIVHDDGIYMTMVIAWRCWIQEYSNYDHTAF